MGTRGRRGARRRGASRCPAAGTPRRRRSCTSAAESPHGAERLRRLRSSLCCLWPRSPPERTNNDAVQYKPQTAEKESKQQTRLTTRHAASHYAAPCHTTPHRTAQHHKAPHKTPCNATTNRTTPHRPKPYHALPRRGTPQRTAPHTAQPHTSRHYIILCLPRCASWGPIADGCAGHGWHVLTRGRGASMHDRTLIRSQLLRGRQEKGLKIHNELQR